MLDQSLKGSFGRGISKNRRIFKAGLAHHRTGCGGRDNNYALAFSKNWQELLHQEEWPANVCRKKVVKILYRVLRDACRLADSGIENEHIQSIAHDGAHLFGEQRSAVRSSHIRRDRLCASAFRLDLGDESFRFLRGAAIVN